MKQTLTTLLFLLILTCIVFTATAQTNISLYHPFQHFNEQPSPKSGLPTNRAAFIFSNSSGNSEYTNPAIALLFTKNTNSLLKNTNTETVSVISSSSNPQTQESKSICMYPNLTEDELWINIENEAPSANQQNVEIYNSTGERVYYSAVNTALHKINLCDFTAGTFLVKLDDNVQKIIIE
ncbi:MAG: T9SS type A sorting domain-containing protein [Chitinophagales bacterium]